MFRVELILSLTVILVTTVFGIATQNPPDRTTRAYPNFQLDVIVNGRPLTEYYARGRTYVEALQGAEYELRLRNDSADRVAVALSVDGLNTIDARHTSAWNASKWVIEPYQTITISGWQMSSERARRFYFTDEQDSYATKLGRGGNPGVITAVFFRQKNRPIPITRGEYPSSSGGEAAPRSSANASADGEVSRRDSRMKSESQAATGIGRSVQNDVEWVDMELDSRPVAEVTVRYEYSRRRVSQGSFSPEP